MLLKSLWQLEENRRDLSVQELPEINAGFYQWGNNKIEYFTDQIRNWFGRILLDPSDHCLTLWLSFRQF